MAARFQDWFNRNIWNLSSEERSRTVNLENPKAPIDGFALDQILGGGNSYTGRSVSFENSLTLSAYYRALAIKSGVISSLPFKVYKKTDSGRIELKPGDHPAAKLFSRKVNSMMTKAVYLERSAVHFDAFGNHVAIPVFNRGGVIEELILVDPKNCEVIQYENKVVYKIKNHGTLMRDDVIHVPNMGNGIWGKSVVKCAMEDFALQMTTREYGGTFYSKGGRPTGLISPKTPQTNTQAEQRQELWNKAKAKGGDIVAPYGVDYTPISLPPEEAAFLATNSFGITTISRWTGVPPEKLGDHANASYNNFEHSGISFLQDTMLPIANKYEAEYTSQIFQLESEQDLYFEFNMDAYLRADAKTKAELFSKYIFAGIKTPDEIRKLNNDPEVGGNAGKLFMQSGTVPIDSLGIVQTPRTRKSLRKKIEEKLKEGMDPQLIIEEFFENGSN